MFAPCPFQERRSWALSERSPVTVSWPKMPKYKRNGLHFVASVDADPKNLHDVMFYAIGALLSATMRLASCNTFSSQDHAEAGFAKTGIAQFWHRLSLC